MFKKIEIWILYLFILLSLIGAVLFGFLVRQETVGYTKLGVISKTALFLAEIPVNIKNIFPNLKVEDRFPESSGFSGDPLQKQAYMLLSRYYGDLKDGIVELVDLKSFKILHTWNPNLNKINNTIEQKDEFSFLKRDASDRISRLLHPALTKYGNLIFNNVTPLIEINHCSEPVQIIDHDLFHHSIEIDKEHNIWAPSHMYPQKISEYKIGRNITEKNGYYDDAIVQISPAGEILYEKSVSEIFIENDMEYLLFSVGSKDVISENSFGRDPIHLNDIEPVNSDSEFWRKGDVFLSLRHQSMVILFRPSENKIIWKSVGKFFHQHDVDIINDHQISIFNNNSKNFYNGDRVDGVNEVLIFDFKTNSYSKYLEDSLIEHDIRTITQGRSEILPNGDLFIEESNYARTLYFNSDGSLRWYYINRALNGSVYQVGWSRILYRPNDINIVNTFLNEKIEDCKNE